MGDDQRSTRLDSNTNTDGKPDNHGDAHHKHTPIGSANRDTDSTANIIPGKRSNADKVRLLDHIPTLLIPRSTLDANRDPSHDTDTNRNPISDSDLPPSPNMHRDGDTKSDVRSGR
jgi:hypothetical protein